MISSVSGTLLILEFGRKWRDKMLMQSQRIGLHFRFGFFVRCIIIEATTMLAVFMSSAHMARYHVCLIFFSPTP